MFGIKIIKQSDFDELNQQISLSKVKEGILTDKIESLEIKANFLIKSNRAQLGTIEALQYKIEELTPTRDAVGRYAKKKQIYGTKN